MGSSDPVSGNGTLLPCFRSRIRSLRSFQWAHHIRVRMCQALRQIQVHGSCSWRSRPSSRRADRRRQAAPAVPGILRETRALQPATCYPDFAPPSLRKKRGRISDGSRETVTRSFFRLISLVVMSCVVCRVSCLATHASCLESNVSYLLSRSRCKAVVTRTCVIPGASYMTHVTAYF